MTDWNQQITLRQLIILGLQQMGLEYNFIINAIIHFAKLTENFKYLTWTSCGEIEVTTLHPTQLKICHCKNYGVIFQSLDGSMLYFGIGGSKQYLSAMQKWTSLETSRNTIGEALEDFGLRYERIIGSVAVRVLDDKLAASVGVNSDLLSVHLDQINPLVNNPKILAGQIGCATWLKMLSSQP